jgi:hypothetical protein
MLLNLKLPRLLALLVAAATTCSASAADEPAPPETPITPAPAIERAPLPSRSDAMASGLLHQLPAGEFVSLEAGGHDFVALWQPANAGTSKGVIILLPGEGESADWPQGIGPLRRGLPDHGWHTLSVSLPDSPSLIPQRYAEVENVPTTTQPDQKDGVETEEPAEEESPEEAGYLPEETAAPTEDALPAVDEADDAGGVADNEMESEQITERIQAALEYARSKQPASIVFLGQGNGAYWAARFVQQHAPANVTRLLIIQPRQPEGQEQSLAELVPSLKLATGDFYYEAGSGNQAAARDRLNASRRIKHPAYRQIKLAPQTGNRAADQEQLLRRVRGWLTQQP